VPSRKADLDTEHDAYRFTIYDRDFLRMRRCDWLLRHRPGLRMRYRLHEVLDFGDETYTPKHLAWEVREISKDAAWHGKLHGHSKSTQRNLFDLSWIGLDMEEYPRDPHTSFYMGSSSFAYVKARLLEGVPHGARELVPHVHNARTYLRMRAAEYFEHEYFEQRWAAMLQLGEFLEVIDQDSIAAAYWYKKCWV
jgi:hypothetical protein